MEDGFWRSGRQYREFHSTVVVAPDAIIADGVFIDPHVTIYPGVTISLGVHIFAGAVIGRPPMTTGIVPPKEFVPLTFIGEGSVIGSNATLYAGVTLGDRVLIGDGVRIRENSTVGDDSVVGSNSTIQNDAVIGSRVRIVDLSHITAGVTIEDDVFWSVAVVSMNDNRDGQGLYRLRVGKGAFIGGGALLLPGNDIGDHAMVAAGAVVTHPVEAGSRVQGIPARRVHDLAYDGTPGVGALEE